MGEYIGTTVTFGGKVKRSDIDDLVKVMLDGGEDEIETAQAEKRGVVTVGESNFGRAEELCGMLEDLGLSYRRCCDAKYEYDGECEIFDATTGKTHEVSATQDGDPYLTYADLCRMAKEGKQLTDVIRTLGEIANFKIPPIEIVEDVEEAAEAAAAQLARAAGWRFEEYEGEQGIYGGFWWRRCKDGEESNDPDDQYFPGTPIMSADSAEGACQIDEIEVKEAA
jgi:hypothetical protein